LLAAAAAPAAAREVRPLDPGTTYIQARAAALSGDHARSAQLFAALAQQTNDEVLRGKAISAAIGAGDVALALKLSANAPATLLPLEARLLLIGEDLKARRLDNALARAAMPDARANLAFLGPFIRAWAAADRKDWAAASAALDSVPANGLLASYRDQQRALILLKLKRPAEALPYIQNSLGEAAIRGDRLRLAFADGLQRAGDREHALVIVDQMGLDGLAAKARLQRGRSLKQAIDTPAEAFSDLVMAFGLDLGRDSDSDLPIKLLQVARAADPNNSSAALLLGYFLARDGRTDDARAIVRTVRDDDMFADNARQLEARVLSEAKRPQEALALARAMAMRRDATMDDVSTLAAILFAAKRYPEAAEAYARAIAMAPASGSADLSSLYLNRASALQQAGRWPEARQVLETAIALSPQQPMLLNNLGYSKLERGEDLDQAEAMIRKAASLAPNDAAITDSLGWALFKRGKVNDAIKTLQEAAVKDPAEPEIREHLGDALYAAGRRYEARFAWNAALVTADDDVAARIKAKLSAGLTPATAAP
jgi:tetratricopeptide (TPR) repeat protein